MSEATPTRVNDFIRVNDDTIIAKAHIVWIKQLNDCLEICTKKIGCTVGEDTHRSCDKNNKYRRHFNWDNQNHKLEEMEKERQLKIENEAITSAARGLVCAAAITGLMVSCLI
jgi:hypothetical protein